MQRQAPTDELLKVEDVMRIFKVGRATAQRWCRDGILPAAKIGKEYRIKRSALEHLYETLLAQSEKSA